MTTAVEVAEKGHQLAAWVNFNGKLDENSGSLTTGENALIRASYNVSSVYFNGTGDYTVNFATAMPDANYSVVITSGRKGVTWGIPLFSNTGAYSAGSIRFLTQNPTDNPDSNEFINLAVFR